MKILILYSTRDGQTREIAQYIADQLLTQGAQGEVRDLHAGEAIAWSDYQGVVIGASIRYGHFHPLVAKFVAAHLAELNQLPSAFYSVNLVARKAEKSTPETNSYTQKFLQSSPWQPRLCAVFAGALRYPRYGWLDRFMIRLIMKMTHGETDTSKEVVYTDWQRVAVFAQQIEQMVNEASLKPTD